MTVNIAVIGCGAATDRYYVPALKKFRNKIDNLYLVDTNLSQAEKIAQAVGRGQVRENYREIIGCIDGAVIVVPHFLHHPVAVELLNSGVAVLCEKPLAEEPHQAREMVSAAAMNNVPLCANYTRRMFPNLLKIKEIISEGRIGRLHSIEYVEGATFGWASATGFYVDPKVTSKGILLDLGPHVLDTICWWLGLKPVLQSFEDDSFGGPESVISMQAEADGCKINVFLNRLVDLDSRFKICGEKGVIEGEPMDWRHVRIRYTDGRTEELTLPLVSKNYPGFLLPVFENYLDVLQDKSKPLVSGGDVVDSIQLIDECYKNRRRFTLPGYEDLQKTQKRYDGKVLVTGASGFIGGRITEVLYLTDMCEVKAAINRWASAARIGRFPVDIVQMDLLNRDAIENALDGVTDIVHCAKGSYEVTVKGTQNLLEAALKRGVRRFIHLSTTEVYGDVTGQISEDAPLQYTGNEYNRMKVDAEKVCWDYLKKGMPVTVLRPSIVYGPFSKNWTIHIARMLIDRRWGIFENIGEGKCNLIYVDDLVKAILSTLANENALGEAFNLTGPEVITWNDYFRRYNEMLGCPPLKTIVHTSANIKTVLMQPLRILGGFARDHFMGTLKKLAETFEALDRMMRKMENALKATPQMDELRLYGRKVVYSNKKARSLIKFEPQTGIASGLLRSVRWIDSCGLSAKK